MWHGEKRQKFGAFCMGQSHNLASSANISGMNQDINKRNSALLTAILPALIFKKIVLLSKSVESLQ